MRRAGKSKSGVTPSPLPLVNSGTSRGVVIHTPLVGFPCSRKRFIKRGGIPGKRQNCFNNYLLFSVFSFSTPADMPRFFRAKRLKTPLSDDPMDGGSADSAKRRRKLRRFTFRAPALQSGIRREPRLPSRCGGSLVLSFWVRSMSPKDLPEGERKNR